MAARTLTLNFSKDGDLGSTFLDGIPVPHKARTIHSFIHDEDSPTTVELRNAFGHLPKNKKPYKSHSKALYKTEAEWKELLTKEFWSSTMAP